MRHFFYIVVVIEIVALYAWAILSWVKTQNEWTHADVVRKGVIVGQEATGRVTAPVRLPFRPLPLTVRVETRMERTENLMEAARKRYRIRFSSAEANAEDDPRTAAEALEGRYLAFDLRPAGAILALGLVAMWLVS